MLNGGANPDERLNAAGTSYGPTTGGLVLLDPRSWTKPAPPRLWNVPDWVPRGVVTSLYGDGGIGKTLLAQQLLTCTATGKDWCGLPVTAGRALGIFCEDDEDELHRRQEAINRRCNCTMGELQNLRMLSRFGDDNALVRFDSSAGSLTEFHGRLEEACEVWKPDLLVLDTASDLYPDNENDRSKVRWFIQTGLGRLARRFNCGLVLLAHPSQSGLRGDGSAGSTAWNNTVRSRLYLAKEDAGSADSGARTLKRAKANYAAGDAVLRLVWDDGALIRADAPVGDASLPWDTINKMFDEIDRPWIKGGPSWSNAPQARGTGRYFPKWASETLGVPLKRAEFLLKEWLHNRVLTIELFNKTRKEYGLRVLKRLPNNG
jgi:putative DNA primase/helicase